MARIALSEPVPAALAATQSLQSLGCLFLSLFSLPAIPPGHRPPLATMSVYARKYGGGVEGGRRAEAFRSGYRPCVRRPDPRRFSAPPAQKSAHVFQSGREQGPQARGLARIRRKVVRLSCQPVRAPQKRRKPRLQGVQGSFSKYALSWSRSGKDPTVGSGTNPADA